MFYDGYKSSVNNQEYSTIGIIHHNGESYEINSIADIDELLEEIKGESKIPIHENIRGKEYYK